MASINAADPASKTIYVFTEVGQLHDAIKNFGFIPIRKDGSQFVVQDFEGGYLLDGAPINVWMGLGWYEGQFELLKPFWDSGQIPRPPQDVLALPATPMPPEVQEAYETFKTAQQPLGANQGLIIAAVAAGAAMFLLSRR